MAVSKNIKNFVGGGLGRAAKMKKINQAIPKGSLSRAANITSGAGKSYKTAAGGITGTIKRSQQRAAGRNFAAAGREMSKNFNDAGGWSAVAGTAVRSAAVGAGVGAVGGLAQGEDMWEGAAKGAMVGGLGGATVRGSRMAVGAGAGTGFLDAASGMNSRHEMSDSVKTLTRNAGVNRSAINDVLKNKGGPNR